MLTQKKLYLVTINMGGWVHSTVRTLNRRRSQYDKGYDYWDGTGDYGFSAEEKRKLGTYKTSGMWEFLFEDKKEAQIFLNGAKAAKDFLLGLWQ